LVAEDDEGLGAVLVRGLREQGYISSPQSAIDKAGL